MKSLILFIIFTLALSANELHYEHSLTKAMQRANNEHKEILMIYSAKWCPECNYMKDVVFKDDKVFKYIQKHYILLTLDIQKDNLPKGYDYIGIPTFFFLSRDAKEKHKIIGGSKADIFLTKLKALR